MIFSKSGLRLRPYLYGKQNPIYIVCILYCLPSSAGGFTASTDAGNGTPVVNARPRRTLPARTAPRSNNCIACSSGSSPPFTRAGSRARRWRASPSHTSPAARRPIEARHERKARCAGRAGCSRDPAGPPLAPTGAGGLPHRQARDRGIREIYVGAYSCPA